MVRRRMVGMAPDTVVGEVPDNMAERLGGSAHHGVGDWITRTQHRLHMPPGTRCPISLSIQHRIHGKLIYFDMDV